ncbi:putative 6-hydroxy-D-nicotine oxidase [Glarea lozoyensis 74030]|uniref:Putative 6-hydroxy-D-nicotine oxidase n=1 Tax=Glarea lozoyensis (strain ATCC 74030 / MF5533) TaxID=1104152 RepID=H0EH72_GLAL7|nr:putative 6-hydroxy-D-nicotine oxidase [Glarea lozoyensis 74030]
MAHVPDLFWAVRGAGSSFGIVAEFEFSTFEAPNHVTPFTIDLFWNEAQAVEGFEALQDFAISAPRELNQWLFMDGATTAYVHRDKLLLYQFSDIETHGQYPEDGFAVLQQFRKSVTDSLDDGKWGILIDSLVF